MSAHFSRSLRTLDSEDPRRATAFFTFIVVFLSAWMVWFVTARVSVYATGNARLEVNREVHPVDTVVGGRVVAVKAAVGQSVKAGDILLELDALPERFARTEEQARLAPVSSQLNLLQQELAAQEQAREKEQRAAQAAVAEADVAAERARTAASFAAEEAKRLSDLRDRRLISEMDALRAENAATERRDDARSADLAAQRLTRELETREQDRLVQIARLKREIATIEGTRAEARAASDRIGYAIEQRTVRAAVSGTIAEVSPLKSGTVIAQGTRICTIVPDGELKIVAFFSPSAALGRIRSGQPARVRLDGFPWTQYGSPTARVSSVGGEPRDGLVRVELALDDQRFQAITLQHGLPAEVDIEVERTSPASLVMRSIGVQTRLAAAAR